MRDLQEPKPETSLGHALSFSMNTGDPLADYMPLLAHALSLDDRLDPYPKYLALSNRSPNMNKFQTIPLTGSVPLLQSLTQHTSPTL